jgi:hypothetical protein
MNESKDVGLDNFRLGELYEMACNALQHLPNTCLTEALNHDKPHSQLIKLIVSSSTAAPQCTSFAKSMTFHDTTQPPPPLTPSTHVLSCLYSISPSNHRLATENLKKFLKPHIDRAIKRQLIREQDDINVLPSVVKKKLSDPKRLPLTAEESCECLTSCVAYGAQHSIRAKDKNIIVVLGNTGAGKSSFVNLLHGCKFELNKEHQMVVSKSSKIPELMKIGHNNRSQTFCPQVENVGNNDLMLKNYVFVDCPGFLDNRGFEVNIANAVNIKKTIGVASTARVVVIINYHSLMSDRGKGVQDLFRIITSIFGTEENANLHAKSLLLGLSHAPVMHPETGLPTTLDQHRAKLLDPSGLDNNAANLLRSIGKDNVFCFHLLESRNDIDKSWLKRKGIANRIKNLVPIVNQSSSSSSTSPSSPSSSTLFQSAVDDADKENLRRVVSSIGEKIQMALTLGAFDMAVDLVHLLRRLERTVEDKFISAVVNEIINHAVTGDRKESIVSSILGVVKIDENEKIDETEDICKNDLEKMRKVRLELERIAAYLIAFAGIDDLRENLSSMLIQGVIETEQAIMEKEAAQGRREANLTLKELVRVAGKDVVKEVLLLQKGEDDMKKNQEKEMLLLKEEMKKCTMNDVAARERHDMKSRKLSYRADAANEVWSAHSDSAVKRMEQRDSLLLSTKFSDPFWFKVNSTLDLFCKKENNMKLVDWNRKGLDEADCEIIAAQLRRLKAPPGVRRLFLSGNQISDKGITAIAHSTSFGSFPLLENFHAQNNGIGDAGFSCLSLQIGEGHLQHLTLLDLGRNTISDDGMAFFASVLVETDGKILQSLTTLYLSSNNIRCAGATSFASAVSSNEKILKKLEILWLNRNKIGADGITSVLAAISSGALVSLHQLMLQGNPGYQSKVQKETEKILSLKKGEKKEREVLLNADQYQSMRGL